MQPLWISCTKKNRSDLKGDSKIGSYRKVGVVVSRKGQIAVQEYSELPSHFEAPLAHIGLFCFSLSFVERNAQIELPWHLAEKNIKIKKFGNLSVFFLIF
jgi:UDP-N-acetylglucosamine pyrophosphorylase